MAEQTVELAPGESRIVSFEATPHEAKTYQVVVDGLTGSFKAIAAPVAEFAYVSDIRHSIRYGIPIWEWAHKAEIDIKNVGAIAGVCSVSSHWREYIPTAGWSGWKKGYASEVDELYCLLSATLQPGEVVTFYEEYVPSYYATKIQIYFTGSPGTSATREIPGVAEFTYVSEIRFAGTEWDPDVGYIKGWTWEVDIQNVGTGAGTCHSTVYVTFSSIHEPTGWFPWAAIATWAYLVRDLSLAPGEVGTIKWWSAVMTARDKKDKVEGDAGTILGPVYSGYPPGY